MALRTLSLDPSARPLTVHLAGRLTCLCPVNGRRDYAQVEIAYTPVAAVAELESFAAWLSSFAMQPIGHEAATDTLADDFAEATEADDITVRTRWDAVEGVECVVVAHR